MVKFIVTSLFFILFSFQVSALSEYGRKCEENSSCKSCREDMDCVMCMNNCWNMYGPAETENSSLRGDEGRDELCRIKRAKWCNAQCWDPDDRTNPDYVSTKPKCGDSSYPKYYNGKRPW